jgi:hypothetical protein
MGIPLAGDFDVVINKPVDSRFVWTGTASNLNNISNKYPGLVSYVTGEKNLYMFKGFSTINQTDVWEKVVTNNVDDVQIYNTNFTININNNGQVIYVNSTAPVTGTIQNFDAPDSLPEGFNVTVIQINQGNVIFNDTITSFFKNRINANKTAGRYAIASILKLPNSNEFLLYGDVI